MHRTWADIRPIVNIIINTVCSASSLGVTVEEVKITYTNHGSLYIKIPVVMEICSSQQTPVSNINVYVVLRYK